MLRTGALVHAGDSEVLWLCGYLPIKMINIEMLGIRDDG